MSDLAIELRDPPSAGPAGSFPAGGTRPGAGAIAELTQLGDWFADTLLRYAPPSRRRAEALELIRDAVAHACAAVVTPRR